MTDQNFDNDLVKNTESREGSTEDNAQSAKVTDEQVINWIKSRRSIGNLTIPAPRRDQIEAAIACAMTAPDHKKLQPWRFIVTEGQKRHDFGRALLAAAQAKWENVRDAAKSANDYHCSHAYAVSRKGATF